MGELCGRLIFGIARNFAILVFLGMLFNECFVKGIHSTEKKIVLSTLSPVPILIAHEPMTVKGDEDIKIVTTVMSA